MTGVLWLLPTPPPRFRMPDTPASDDVAPASDDVAPASEAAAPASEAVAPAGDDAAPVSDGLDGPGHRAGREDQDVPSGTAGCCTPGSGLQAGTPATVGVPRTIDSLVPIHPQW